MSFDVTGITLKLEGLRGQLRDDAALAVEEIADEVLTRSTARVPHEYGDLQNSGQVTTDPENLKAAVSYDTPYAVVQHEDMTLNHDAGREAKYLETSVHEVAQGPAEQILRQRLGKHFKGGR